jgi:hypothetical protein
VLAVERAEEAADAEVRGQLRIPRLCDASWKLIVARMFTDSNFHTQGQRNLQHLFGGCKNDAAQKCCDPAPHKCFQNKDAMAAASANK